MKNVLFIAPEFHGYERIISKQLSHMGFNVDFYPEKINNLRYKIANHISSKAFTRHQDKHYQKIETLIKDKKYDILFVIRGLKMPVSFIENFSKLNPEAKKILYQWDAERVEHFSYLLPHFDKTFSFDPYDCNALGMQYNPLFYTDDIVPSANQTKDIDLFMIGTYLPERYAALMDIIEKYGDSLKIYSYIHIPLTSLIKERLKGNRLDMSICHTKPMQRSEYLRILGKSKAIVDASKPQQTGLAMRIIEALAANVKIVTTNSYIKNLDLYSPNNIHIINPQHISIQEEFLDLPFVEMPHVRPVSEFLKVMFESI